MMIPLSDAARSLLRLIDSNEAREAVDVTTPPARELLHEACIKVGIDALGSAGLDEPMRWVSITDRGRLVLASIYATPRA